MKKKKKKNIDPEFIPYRYNGVLFDEPTDLEKLIGIIHKKESQYKSRNLILNMGINKESKINKTAKFTSKVAKKLE